jgi:hypothetical protein
MEKILTGTINETCMVNIAFGNGNSTAVTPTNNSTLKPAFGQRTHYHALNLTYPSSTARIFAMIIRIALVLNMSLRNLTSPSVWYFQTKA